MPLVLRITLLALAAGGAAPVRATQFLVTNTCHLTEHVPGLLGGKDLHMTVQAATVFSQKSGAKYCGTASMETPAGAIASQECFIIDGAKFTAGSWAADKITSSDCRMVDAASMDSAFSPEKLAPWKNSGSALLTGQAFLKTLGGDVKTCAGATVTLLPATPYTTELLEKIGAGIDVQPDPRITQYSRQTICDAQGNFSFEHLPTLKWYVLTKVTWGVPVIGGSPGDMEPQGGELIKVVTLDSGSNQVFLTERDER